MKKYFYYEPDNGFSLCSTAKEAMEASAETLSLFRDEAAADGEWMNEINEICWGVVVGSIHEIELPDDDYDGSQGVADYSKPVDYKLENICVDLNLPEIPKETRLYSTTNRFDDPLHITGYTKEQMKEYATSSIERYLSEIGLKFKA